MPRPQIGLGDGCGRIGKALAGFGANRCRRFSDQPGLLHGQAVGVERAHRTQAIALHHQQPGAGIDQDVAQLQAARRGIDGHRNRAYPGTAEQGLHELRPVAAQQRHTVSTANASVQQRGAVASGDLQRIAVAPARIARNKQRAIAVAGRLAFQQHGHHPVLGCERNSKGGREVHGNSLRLVHANAMPFK